MPMVQHAIKQAGLYLQKGIPGLADEEHCKMKQQNCTLSLCFINASFMLQYCLSTRPAQAS